MVMKDRLTYVSSSVVDIFYPNQCQICSNDLQSNEKYLCISCLYDLPYIQDSQQQQEHLNQLFWGRVEVKNTWSLFNYQRGNQVQDLLHLIKYKKKTKLAEYLGYKLAEQIPQSEHFDYVLPVPLHPKKLRKRGFNQSTVIAKGIAERSGIKIQDRLLKRIAHNPSQTTVDKYERWENVRNIFQVKKPKRLIGKHVLLIDDVLTTGATLEACIKQLLQVDDCRVSVATLAARI